MLARLTGLKRWLAFGLGLLILVFGVGAGLSYTHRIPVPKVIAAYLPDYSAHSPAVAPPVFNPKTAVIITMPSVQSNLGTNGHYIQVTVSFGVDPAGLQVLGSAASGASSATTGTGDPQIDNEIESDIITIARQSSYVAMQTPQGVHAMAQAIQKDLTRIFGRGQVGDVLFPALLTQ